MQSISPSVIAGAKRQTAGKVIPSINPSVVTGAKRQTAEKEKPSVSPSVENEPMETVQMPEYPSFGVASLADQVADSFESPAAAAAANSDRDSRELLYELKL